jgi:hypothetical protein
MPQPDVIFYGTVARDGKPLERGTLTAILPRAAGGVGTFSATIAPIRGTSFNYALALPMAQYDDGDTNYALDALRLGETVRFTVDGVPALLKTPDGLTFNEYRVDFVGRGYTVTMDMSGPGGYPIGDVNVSGRRDSADALLVLKYDVGLAQGVTGWPPGPGTVYLPLCDITQDGACNSTDALRILLCDVRLATCPGDGTTPASAQSEDLPAPDNLGTDPAGGQDPASGQVQLTATAAVDPTTGEVVVQVAARMPAASMPGGDLAGATLAGVTLDLKYDAARLTATSCAERGPDGGDFGLELAACNPAFSADTIRYTGISTAGIGPAGDGWMPLTVLRFQVLDGAVTDEVIRGAAVIELTGASAFDLDGAALRPVWAPAGGSPPAGGAAEYPMKVFLPGVGHREPPTGGPPAGEPPVEHGD